MDLAAENQVLLKKLLAIVVLMGGFGLALVPFYKKICEVTGISQTRVVTRAEAKSTQVDLTRSTKLRFFRLLRLTRGLMFQMSMWKASRTSQNAILSARANSDM